MDGDANGILCLERYGTKKDLEPLIYVHDRSSGQMKLQDGSKRVSSFLRTIKVWDTLQAFCSSITGALATQAVLKGSGVGDESASVASATITWLLKGLAYSLVGVAGGCTRAALTVHQAKRDNMADVSAKDGSQETLVNLLALLINLLLIPLVSGNIPLTWTLFIIFTFLHIYTNYKAVTCVIMDTFNYARFKIVFNHCYISPGLGEILHPQEANMLEPVIGGSYDSWIKVGCMLKSLELDGTQFTRQLSLNPNLRILSKYSNGIYLAALRDVAKPADIIQAYYEAETKRNSSMLSRKQKVHFVDELQKHGWDVTRHQLYVDEWRWSTDELDKIK